MFNSLSARIIISLHSFHKPLVCLLFLASLPSSEAFAKEPLAIPTHLLAAGKQAISHRSLSPSGSDNSLLLRQRQSFNGDPIEHTMLVPLADANVLVNIPQPLAIGNTHQVVRHTFTHSTQQYQLMYYIV